MPAAVLTFEPHPRSGLRARGSPSGPDPVPGQGALQIERLGVDPLLFVQHFDLAFARKSAESFVDDVLVGAIGATQHVVVGHDCTFGNRRRGTPETLRAAGEGATALASRSSSR